MAQRKIFISYRRADSQYAAGRISDHLSKHFGKEQVFIDVDAIQAGANFVDAINQAVSKCDILIALIGPQWLEAKDENGNRRLDDPADFVRLEISAAFERKIHVVPILLMGALPPQSDQLPYVLQPLAQLNATKIQYEQFDSDIDRLERKLENILDEEKNPFIIIKDNRLSFKHRIAKIWKNVPRELLYLYLVVGIGTIFALILVRYGKISTVFLMCIIFFAFLGFRDGWKKEIVVSASVILAYYTIYIMLNVGIVARYLQAGQVPDSNIITIQQFWFQVIILLVFVFFAIRARRVPRISEPIFERDNYRDSILGLFVGAFNGYLIVGSFWAYLGQAGYPYDLVNPNISEISIVLYYILPQTWLTESPTILFAVIFAFIIIFVAYDRYG